MNNIQYVLDASALLALFHAEKGASAVAGCLENGSAICAVNYCEVLGKCIMLGLSEGAMAAAFDGLNLSILPFDVLLARKAAELRTVTDQYGLSLADRACLALARMLGVPAVTADRVWSNLGVGYKVIQVREL